MAENAISCEQLAEACLARIAILEPTVGAWAYFTREHVLAQARQADQPAAAGARAGQSPEWHSRRNQGYL
jgi:Asp-tRNA(Asn)/Glu-tRNA(Gln) amidotransferase A subunit family amidase